MERPRPQSISNVRFRFGIWMGIGTSLHHICSLVDHLPDTIPAFSLHSSPLPPPFPLLHLRPPYDAPPCVQLCAADQPCEPRGHQPGGAQGEASKGDAGPRDSGHLDRPCDETGEVGAGIAGAGAGSATGAAAALALPLPLVLVLELLMVLVAVPMQSVPSYLPPHLLLCLSSALFFLQVLTDFQENPKAAEQHQRNPMVMAKIQKLVAAGIVQVR